jgi:hypothetical protein
MLLAEPIEIALQIGAVLDALGLDWLVGGSVASSLYGIPRATQDIDLVVDLSEAHVEDLVQHLTADFYIDADMIRQALRRRGSFNIIHLATMTRHPRCPQGARSAPGRGLSDSGGSGCGVGDAVRRGARCRTGVALAALSGGSEEVILVGVGLAFWPRELVPRWPTPGVQRWLRF